MVRNTDDVPAADETLTNDAPDESGDDVDEFCKDLRSKTTGVDDVDPLADLADELRDDTAVDDVDFDAERPATNLTVDFTHDADAISVSRVLAAVDRYGYELEDLETKKFLDVEAEYVRATFK